MIDKFLQYIQYEKNYSSYTVLCYHTDLLQFCDFIGVKPDELEIDKVTQLQVRQWVLFLLNNGINSRSLNRKLSTLKSFWRFLLKRGYTKKTPLLKIIMPKTKKPLPTFFREKELSHALDDTFTPDDFISIRDRLILEVFYATGIRLSELLNLTDDSVDLLEGRMRVVGKRNKERVIPIGEELCRDIENYKQQRDISVPFRETFLFLRATGESLSRSILYRIVRDRMSEFSSLQKRSPHVLRHTFATSMLNGGADINAVKELLGHSSLAATQVYTHASFDELHNIYNRAHPRAK